MDGRASFSDTLKELRNRKHLSRAKLAQRLKVHPSSIEKWERGDVLPDRARVEDVMRALALEDAERLLLLEAHTGHRLLPTLHNLPAVRNPYFTGRAEILAKLHGQIVSGCRVALTQAISGLGGIGKTLLALEYVYRYQKAHTHLFWISADSPETLTREFCSLARDLELPEKDENDPSKVVRAVQRWLCGRNGWGSAIIALWKLRSVISHCYAPVGEPQRQLPYPLVLPRTDISCSFTNKRPENGSFRLLFHRPMDNFCSSAYQFKDIELAQRHRLYKQGIFL